MKHRKAHPLDFSQLVCAIPGKQFCWITAYCLISSLLTSPSNAQCSGGVCPPPSTWQSSPQAVPGSEVQVGSAVTAAVCRVINQTSQETSLGSGTLVLRREKVAYVLTCDHLFRDGVGAVSVRFATGRVSKAIVVARDSQHDLALLEVSSGAESPLRIATQHSGPFATAVGLGSAGRIRAIRGRVVGQQTAAGAKFPSLLIAGAVRSGDSGGPVLDDQGRLVGVVWGVRRQVTYATVGRPLAELLQRLPVPDSTPQKTPVQRAESCACGCDGECVKRQELADYLRIEDWKQSRPQPSAPQSPHAWQAESWQQRITAVLPVAASALGIGGPMGVVWMLFKLTRRGSGGPRLRRFRSQANL